MVRRLLLSLLLLGIAAFFAFPRTCSDVERQPLLVQGDRITVTNTTETAWTDVEVWLNDRYRMQAPNLAAGQRLDMPIRGFVAGFGRLFDPAKEAPVGVEVTARAADGQAVKLMWGQGRRR